MDQINVDAALAQMRQALEETERLDPMTADFYRAHYEGCVHLVDMGKRYRTMPPGKEKDNLAQEMRSLLRSLNESMTILRSKMS